MKEVIKINENTWRIEEDGVRFYLFCGSEKAALIDTGMNSPDAKQIKEVKRNLLCQTCFRYIKNTQTYMMNW